jgi:DNA (cytosine-5)-methyltransferase 1
MSRFHVTDVFSGCGGFSLGFHDQRHFEVRCAIDSWGQALGSIKHNKPTIKSIQADLSLPEVVNEIIDEIANTDILIGGPPCQGFSTLGKRKDGDKRSSLVDVFVDIVNRVRPKIAIVENVRGITSKKHPFHSSYAEALRVGLENGLEGGYFTTSKMLNAANFGVPQNRLRWFMIAVRSDLLADVTAIENFWACLDKEVVGRTPTLREAIGDLPPLENGEEKKTDASGSPLYNHRAMRHSNALVKRFQSVPPLGGLPDVPRDLLTPHLRKMLDGKYGSGGHVKNIYGRMDWLAPSGTIVAGIDKITCGRFVHPENDRLLSPRECARIQSFPDDYQFLGGQVAQYYQIGNAVPPKLSRALANALRRFMSRECISSQKTKRCAA